ncbi:MAG: hypothetical protein R3A44_34075 [Caldilineaceae bacterium]
MSNIKTAVSLERSLFEEAEVIAHQLKITRSRLFAQALEEYIQRRKNRDLLEKINAVYSDEETDDTQYLRAMKSKYRQILDDEEW